jgi:hypothetical protein
MMQKTLFAGTANMGAARVSGGAGAEWTSARQSTSADSLVVAGVAAMTEDAAGMRTSPISEFGDIATVSAPIASLSITPACASRVGETKGN